MLGSRNWIKAGLLAGSALTLAACSTYPTEPRYSTRPVPTGQAPVPYGQSPYATRPQTQPSQPAQQPNNPYYQPNTPPPVEQGPVAGSGHIDGGGLPPASTGPAYPSTGEPVRVTPPASTGPVQAGAAYIIQPGDTISGVGRRFQTPVQTLIELNGLGPRGAITSGQRIILPTTAVDTGSDPYATGPAPSGVNSRVEGVTPPPPPPPSGNAPLPSARQPAATVPQAPAQSSTPLGQTLALQWPVRGDILRRFGPTGMGERNNGINIGASAGAEVKASADGTVAYVGDDIVGQGLTVLIVHRDGWRTVYSHLGSSTVRDGAQVRAGQVIGTVGTTAGDGRPSIHYEVRQMRGDDPVAMDPLGVLPR
ncbi:peptidoglycan DD-metalloendopeptidase family protein [Brevundimonas sp. BH3]|uniref:peptidoglycan DD-metalloendopeptidase family protein n=1 Tax=Brevundimonas sp. BH3 TaxID=3133089 RepID=UPI00324CE69C